MKGKRIVLSFAVMAMTVSGGVMANEIYKWTDEDGNVHYEDRPVGEEVERVAVSSSNTSNSAVRASIDARRAREEARADARSEREEEAQKAAEAEQLAAERVQKCEESRSRMESYLQARRLYKEDENGERVYLDESQIMDARSQAQDDIQAYCG